MDASTAQIAAAIGKTSQHVRNIGRRLPAGGSMREKAATSWTLADSVTILVADRLAASHSIAASIELASAAVAQQLGRLLVDETATAWLVSWPSDAPVDFVIATDSRSAVNAILAREETRVFDLRRVFSGAMIALLEAKGAENA